jgi:hypothetical protein
MGFSYYRRQYKQSKTNLSKPVVELKTPGKKVRRIALECGDDIHIVSIHVDGDVVFHSHDMEELKASLIMDRLRHMNYMDSEMESGCALLYRHLQERAWSLSGGYYASAANMDDSLKRVIRDCFTTRWQLRREMKTSIQNEEIGEGRWKYFGGKKDKDCGTIGGTLAERMTNRFGPVVEEVIAKANGYRQKMVKAAGRGSSNMKREVLEGSQEIKVVFVENENQTGVSVVDHDKAERPSDRREKVTLTFSFPTKWYTEIFKKGLAVIDGVVVFSVFKRFDNGLLVAKVGKQAYGFSIEESYALVDPVRQKTSFISEDRAHELAGGAIPRKRRTKAEMAAAGIEP